MRVGELGRFGAAGLVATVVDVAAFYALVEAGVPALVANPVSMAVRLGVAFWVTRAWVFRDRDARGAGVELPLFLLVATANVLVVEAVLGGAHLLAGGEPASLVATGLKVGAVVLTFFARYAVSRRWVFRAN
ncbi:MAG: GtrA family protein [Acidimicrobiia bacterium]|nr:GtrA family protein [Acidimicrobiia bacterium]